MESIKEDINCYASRSQRDVLIELITNSSIENDFFLTGGTTLSVFYLHHRLSNDLDFFTIRTIDLGEIDFWIKLKWAKKSAKIKESFHCLSYLIHDVRVDFAIDTLSIDEKRERYTFENGHHLSIDTINNIVSNKFCAIVSRTEPKDYVDFYMILKFFPALEIKNIYQQSRLKDAIFDDPPTAAFQIENGIDFVKENLQILPKTFIQLDLEDFFGFYKNVVAWLYRLLKI